MMLERFALVDLAEDCGRVIQSFYLPSYEEARILDFHRVGKRKLRARKDANRNRGIFCRGKPARAGTKVACGQFEPLQRVEELVCVVGRRGGKSRAMATLVTYIAGLCEHDELAPGEQAICLCIAPDQDQ